MSFTKNALKPISVENSLAGKLWMYEETGATLAAISAASYFDGAAPEMNLTDEDVIFVIASDGMAFFRVNVSSGTVTILDRMGTSAIEVLAAAKTLTAADNGKTFYLNVATGVAITLPDAAVGLKYKFVHGATAVTSNGHVISATDDDGDNIKGTTIVNGSEVSTTGADVITMTANAAIPGDWVSIESDGTNWYVTGQAAAATGIAFS